MTETPLDTAQRIWPGAWSDFMQGQWGRSELRRELAATEVLSLILFLSLRNGVWTCTIYHNGYDHNFAKSYDIETALTTARDRVQALATIIFKSAGVVL